MTTKNGGSDPGKVAPQEQKLSANEKAFLDSIRSPLVKSILVRVWATKVRLQFSGWLQYIPPLIITLVVFLVAALIHLVGFRQAALPFSFVGSVLLAIQAFDLVTVKFRFRFPEALPKRKDTMDLFDLMRSRRSCRSFQTRKLTDADHRELMESVRIHTEEPKLGSSPIRFEYISAPLTVWPTVNATEFFVAIAPKKYDRLAVMDVGRSLQKIVMDATRMGLGTCWIGPGADHASIMKDLGDRFNEETDHIICVCAVGYPSKYIPLFIRIFNAVSFRRLPLSSLFFADPQLKTPLNLDVSPYHQFGRTYEICQWSPSSYNGQTTRGVAVTKKSKGGEPSVERFDFYAITESRYYAAVATGIWLANWEMGCEALGIAGHLTLLSAKERGIQDEKSLPPVPRYDMSWIPNKNI